jgi:phage terminase large subunit GpA-like protein
MNDQCGYTEEFFRQLFAERIYTKYHLGRPYTVYRKQKNDDRNEALDITLYRYAAARIWNRNMKTLHSLMKDFAANAGIDPISFAESTASNMATHARVASVPEKKVDIPERKAKTQNGKFRISKFSR